jgi:predicted phosphoribosyltransferase
MFRNREEAGRRLADETLALEIPNCSQAVAQVYEHWYNVPDHAVLGIFEECDKTQEQSEETLKKNQC